MRCSRIPTEVVKYLYIRRPTTRNVHIVHNATKQTNEKRASDIHVDKRHLLADCAALHTRM